jgi:CubicO group peptidase (beta-lactamase class C family)
MVILNRNKLKSKLIETYKKTILSNYLLILIILFFSVFTNTTAQNNKNKELSKELTKDSLVIEKVNNYLEEFLALENFSGSILVARDSTILIDKSIGMANYEHLVPNNSKTKYRIASLSKAFAAVLILQQVEKGKINLEGKIRDYLPFYPKKTGNEITIHQLLTHSAGLQHYEGVKDFYFKYGQVQFYSKDYLKVFWNLPLLYEPGTSHSYSSFGYFILGCILQEVTGKSYSTLLKENILDPLGLQNTGVDDHLTIVQDRASGYIYNNYVLMNSRYYDMSKSMATGDLYSTTRDLNKWSFALNTNLLLSEKYRKLLFNPFINGYGYGWSIKKFVSKDTNKTKEELIYAVHSGSTRGFESYLNKFLTYGYTIVILSNQAGAKVGKINEEITKIIIGDY